MAHQPQDERVNQPTMSTSDPQNTLQLRDLSPIPLDINQQKKVAYEPRKNSQNEPDDCTFGGDLKW